MLTTIFILAVLNLCLGFLLAANAERLSSRLVGLLATRGVATLPTQPTPPCPVEVAPEPDEPIAPVEKPAPFDSLTLPSVWRDLLDDNGIKPHSALESLLWTFKLELCILRGTLVHMEDELRNLDKNAAEGNPQVVANVLANWGDRHLEWAGLLNEFITVLASIREQPTHAAIDSSLHDLLLEQQFDCHQTTTELKFDSTGTENAAASTTNAGMLRRQLSEQIDHFHLLRDGVDDLLATFLRDMGLLGAIGDVLQTEGASEIYNRLGFEGIFRQWRNSDPNNEQPLCCLLVDIDRFSQKNERFGNSIGDIVIAAFGGLLKSLIRNERGFDRVARFNSHSYVLFLGYTTLENAKIVAERTRQCVEATSFRVGEQTFDVTTSLGIVKFDPSMDLPTFYQSLQTTVAAAKNAGRNRTCALSNNQPEIVKAASIQVKGRVIEIAARG